MRVYVSSTRVDFEREREAVMKWLVDADHQPVHSYVADSDTVRESCLADIEGCELFVLLLCHRYGFRPADGNPENLSITHLEFRRAGEVKVPRIALLRTSIPNVALSSIRDPVDGPAVMAFRDEVARAVTPAEFNDPASLIGTLSAAVAAELRKRDTAAYPPSHGGAHRWSWPSPWDFAAYMTAKRAHFSGRAWLFDEIEAWLQRMAPRDLLLRADFGVGKSAFIAEMVARDGLRPKNDRRVLAYHFCQHDTHETLRPGTFVRSLAAQLAQNLPGYRAAVEGDPVGRQQLDRAAEDPGSAFEAAILNPLTRIQGSSPRLILVDALDESVELEETETRRGTLVEMLAEKVPRFPAWIRLLVTSRNNPAVTDRLKAAFGPKQIDAEARLNLDDIRAYALRRATTEPLASMLVAANVSPESVADRLRDKSGGKFLYVERALDDVTQGRLGAGDLERLPAGMDAFYLAAFERRFVRTTRDYARAAHLLGVMAVAREPLGPNELAEILGAGVQDVKALRSDALSDFIRIREGTWTFDHFSLREWLTTEDGEGAARAGRYSVDVAASKAALADWALEAYEAPASTGRAHALRHLPAYLHDTHRADRLRALLLDLRWLHAKLAHSGPQPLRQDFDFAPADSGLTLLARTLDMCVHILARDPRQLTGQLLGRLHAGMDPGLRQLIEACRTWTDGAWLRPVTASLPPAGNLVRVFQGHNDIIQNCAFSPGGESVLSASADGTARLWRPNGELIATLDAGPGPLNFASFSADGQWVATMYAEKNARVWTKAGSLARVLETPTSCIWATFSPDSELVMVTCRDHVARVWDHRKGALLLTLEGHARRVVHGSFSPDGRMIATGSTDNTARLWLTEGQAVAELKGHTAAVAKVIFSPDGTLLVTASSDNTARLWDTNGHFILTLSGHLGPVNDVAFSPDGRVIATASNDNTARLWRTSGEQVAVLKGHTGWVNHVCFSPDGKHVVTGSSDYTARLWSSAGELLAELRGHSGWIVHTAFSPDGKFVLTCANDGTLRLWNNTKASVPPRIGHSDRISAVAFSPDASAILTTSNDRTAVLWDRFGRPAQTLRGHDEWISHGEFHPDGERLVTGSADATARIWSTTGVVAATLDGHEASINHVACSPTGDLIATASNDNTARLWLERGDIHTALTAHLDAVNHVGFSPDGLTIVTSSNDATAGLWTCEGTLLRLLAGHSGWVNQTCFSPDGKTLASASQDGTVRVWNADGTLVAGTGRPH